MGATDIGDAQMASTYRMTVPGESDAQQAELRLGSYMSGDDGFPLNYTGDQTSSTGVLMTTKGEFALVSGKPLFAQAQKTVDINVSSGNYTSEAAEGFTFTSHSLYVQAASGITANSAVPTVASGEADLTTTGDFHAHSYTSHVIIDCEEGGYSCTMRSGWHEIWGNQKESSQTEMGVNLLECIDIPVIFNFNYDTYYCLIRLSLTGFAGNASTASLLSSEAVGTELEMHQVKTALHGIKTRASALKTRIGQLISDSSVSYLDNISFDITEEDIMSDLLGVGNEINVAPQINTV